MKNLMTFDGRRGVELVKPWLTRTNNHPANHTSHGNP